MVEYIRNERRILDRLAADEGIAVLHFTFQVCVAWGRGGGMQWWGQAAACMSGGPRCSPSISSSLLLLLQCPTAGCLLALPWARALPKRCAVGVSGDCGSAERRCRNHI